MTASVDVGTNGGAAWTRPAAVPARSDLALVSSTLYDAAGRAWVTTDPRGVASRAEYDLLGRVTKRVEDYQDGVRSDADDKTTEYGYGPAGMTSLTARLSGGDYQTTQWVYGVTAAGGSGLNSNDVAGETRWPDPSTGAASAAEKDTVTVNALGQTVTTTDRNGTVHALGYDALGRFAEDAVTLLGVGVDGAVRRVGVGYDGQGNAAVVTSYSAASGGSVVNQVSRTYDGLGQLAAEAQEHAGAVTPSTPQVRYGYDFAPGAGGANRSRMSSMTYPDGRVVGYSYGTAGGLDDRIGRLAALTDSGVTLEGYGYLGLGTVVTRSHPQAGVDLTYVKRAGEADGEAGDSVAGLDRFGRVADQRWVTTAGVDLDRHTYGYDRGGNRLYRDDMVNPAFGEVYSYDGLSQVTGFQRGTLNAAKTGLVGAASRSQGYAFDALGNFTSVTTDGVSQARTANRQNEVTGVAGATTLTFDAGGNMTGDETGRQFTYDAWNRLVGVKSAGGVLLKSYAYDGLGRRVTETPAGLAATELYYSAGWQVLEERVGGVAKASYVWSPVYVDALVARDRDADGSSATGASGREERLYALADANYNVTALVGVDGIVKERYAYDAFGGVTMMDAGYGVVVGSGYGWGVLFQGMHYDSTTGLYSSRYRYGYSPTQGRWIQVDPIKFKSGEQNFYSFVNNDPANWIDPSGLQRGNGDGGLPRNQWPNWARRLPGQTNGSESDDAEGGSYIERVIRVAPDFQHAGGAHYDVDYIEEGIGTERTQRYHTDGTPFTDEENSRISNSDTRHFQMITNPGEKKCLMPAKSADLDFSGLKAFENTKRFDINDLLHAPPPHPAPSLIATPPLTGQIPSVASGSTWPNLNFSPPRVTSDQILVIGGGVVLVGGLALTAWAWGPPAALGGGIVILGASLGIDQSRGGS